MLCRQRLQTCFSVFREFFPPKPLVSSWLFSRTRTACFYDYSASLHQTFMHCTIYRYRTLMKVKKH